MTYVQFLEAVVAFGAVAPLVCNLLVVVFRVAGWNVLADWLVRLGPLVVVAASSKPREEKIQILLSEAGKLSPRISNDQLKAVAADLGSEPPPSSAAHVPYATPGKPMPTPKDSH